MSKKPLYLLMLCLIVSINSQADVVTIQGNWQCVARDKAQREWLAVSNYERTAINKAFDACKKASEFPTSCKTAKADCESFVNGVSTSPMFMCTALDQLGTPWVSNLYRNPDDANLAAKAYCQDRSPLPGTCYAYLFLCKSVAPEV